MPATRKTSAPTSWRATPPSPPDAEGGQIVKIYFDGGCRPNPGAMELAVVARGVVLIDRALGHGSSMEAEWRALLRAAGHARTLDDRDIVLLGDSLPVIGQASGSARCRDPLSRDLLAQFREAIRDLPPVRLRHIKRTQNLAGIALNHAGPPADPIGH